jgi:PPK2 family polyphosphate:nucleotide phosphotransferase
VQVFSFKAPSDEELDHDFLWRLNRAVPERGRIGVWNRSHYEEVLVVRVHQELLDQQKLPPSVDRKTIWRDRYESIRGFEQHLARNGTVVIKFFLNVSHEEQLSRLLDRIDDPEANWKFSSRDCDERQHWKAYMEAYQEALRETSRPHAPWYAIPADSKPSMRVAVAEIVVETLRAMKPEFPALGTKDKAMLGTLRQQLLGEGGDHKRKARE